MSQDRHKLRVKPDPHAERRITARKQMAGISNGAVRPCAPKSATVHSPNRLTILDVRDCHCKDVDDSGMWCGNPAETGSSWCAGHRSLYCYPMPPSNRKNSDRKTVWLAGQ